MSLPVSKPTRNGDYRHAQSLGRQRKHAVVTPRGEAEAIYRIIQKRRGDGQPLPDLAAYGVTDNVWTELICLLTNDELETGKDACVKDDDNGGKIPIEPVGSNSPSGDPLPGPSWRDHEPAIVHSLKWHDADGIEHLHVVRADDLDEALRHVLKVKLCIRAARMKEARVSEGGREASSGRPDWCGLHSVQMKQRGEAPHTWYSHKTASGWCKGKGLEEPQA